MRVVFSLLFLSLTISAKIIPYNSSTVCQKCHPNIYNEYVTSMHANASIFQDPLHNAVWQKHPAKKKGVYQCKKCHTPTDTSLEGVPQKNSIQLHEAISCVYCHQIQNIQKAHTSNRNIMSKRRDTLFGARKAQKNQTDVAFHQSKSFFGLVTDVEGSPFHKIDFSNENYYNAKTCMGCHSHKRNGKDLLLCSINEKMVAKSKKSCIDCHMPKIMGSFSTIKKSQKHRYHGFSGLYNKSALLEKYINIELFTKPKSFLVTLHNEASHPLIMHPLRLGVLDVKVLRGKREIALKKVYFFKKLTHNGKPVPAWSATKIESINKVAAFETKEFLFPFTLQKGDRVVITFMIYKVSPKAAKKLQIKEQNLTKPIVFKVVEKEI